MNQVLWNICKVIGRQQLLQIRDTIILKIPTSSFCTTPLDIFLIEGNACPQFAILVYHLALNLSSWFVILLSIYHLGLSYKLNSFVIVHFVLPFWCFGKKGKKECVFHFVEIQSKYCLYLQNILKFLMKFWESEQKF